MGRFTHVIETFLWDRPTWEMPEDYLRYRLDFFHKYTLKSLLNQTDNRFLIFMQLGKRFKHITESYKWHPDVIRCYNHGKTEYDKINTNFLIISRIDSDDLFHKDAVYVIRKKLICHPKRRIVMVFKKNLCWDMINDCIIPHQKVTSPFFTHIFPKRIYKNWQSFSEQHFCEHGNHGAGDKKGRELPPHMVMVIKHGQNVSYLKRGFSPFILTEQQKKQLRVMGKSDLNLPAYDEAVWELEKMNEILKNFGVKYV